MFPIAKEAVEPLKQGDYWKVFYLTLQMSTPAVYIWLGMFYSFFHSYMNFWGEITYFADRRFYDDWWNAGDLGEYWRKWNFPVHSFLIRHVYFPLRRRHVNKMLALFLTFFVSAAAHEYLIIGIFRMANFLAFTLMIINVPIISIQNKFKGVSYEQPIFILKLT
jgi:diacylglycerol O-acyltransferase-1